LLLQVVAVVVTFGRKALVAVVLVDTAVLLQGNLQEAAHLPNLLLLLN
jgi:hypothetical protein